MVASATFTIARSRTTMNWAATTSASAAQGDRARGSLIGVLLIYLPLQSLRVTTIAESHSMSTPFRATLAPMSTTPAPLVKLGTRPPVELMSSTAFLLKRLGFGVKSRTFEAFEAAGESPYHHAVLAVLDENPVETQSAIADAL